MQACASRINKRWKDRQQHNAQEFLRSILEVMQVSFCCSPDTAHRVSVACVATALQLSKIPADGSAAVTGAAHLV